ncbi:GNAT family N-acetyltransferase [Emcibacter nanhaiensis]|uniref:GNAT family N-acetyltransferase n=1 Tax=Emcibacter nanhaiensis TaxID=1505037 RepID=A0A501PQF9_9PROT|nr:GNAT family protein [Emcibacter nanhaiensis]TPD62693.1 GNAT family N-acetyltransferase [Emcibacter nanhaiensis]
MIRIIPPRPLKKGALVHLYPPGPHLRPAWQEFIRDNKDYHAPWIYHSQDPRYFDEYLKRIAQGRVLGFFIVRNDDEKLVGIVNLNNILMGAVRGASLGYYGSREGAGKGYMSEGLKLVLEFAVDKVGLHRIEANIQPDNEASLRLVRKLGFRKEGFSPEYLQIGGEWRDHERWAILEKEVRAF